MFAFSRILSCNTYTRRDSRGSGGIDVAAIVLGIVTFGSVSGFWAVVAGVDIALAGVDAIVQANYDEIKSASPDGEKFLEDYEQFILVAGVATSIPLLTSAPSVLAGLAKLTSKTVAGSRNFVRVAITRAILEINSTGFTKDTLKLIDPQELFLGFEYQSMAQKMTDANVLFVSGAKEGNSSTSFVALYQGEVIAEFNSFTKNKFAKEWARLKQDKIINTLDNIAQTIKYENGRMGYVQGLFDNINVNYKPKGFDFVDTPMSDYGIGYQTTIRYENSSGYFRRHFVNKTKTFIFDHAFPQELPIWIDDVKVPLVQGKGIPTQAYITLRQMKLIGIAEGEIQMVKMSQIQNLDTAAFIHQVTGGKIARNFDSIDILAAPSNEYMKTVMTQAGYETISGRITGKGIYQTVKQLKTRNFPLNPKFEGSYEAFMKEHGLSLDSKLYINYSIEVKVKFIK